MHDLHPSIVRSVEEVGLLVSLITGSPNWQNFFGKHMRSAHDAHPGCATLWPFANSAYGPVMLTMAGGGLGYTDGDGHFSAGVPGGDVCVVVFGWGQVEVDRAMQLAVDRGLTVVRTVRIEDNEVVDLP